MRRDGICRVADLFPGTVADTADASFRGQDARRAVAKVVQDVQLARRRLMLSSVLASALDRQIFVQSQGTVQLQGANANVGAVKADASRAARPDFEHAHHIYIRVKACFALSIADDDTVLQVVHFFGRRLDSVHLVQGAGT